MKPLGLAEPLEQIDRVFVLFLGRKLLYFGGCDYFRLAGNLNIARCAIDSIQRQALLNVAASRLTTGNHPLYEALEATLCHFFKVPAALLTSTGYTANLVVAQALSENFSHTIIDERSHPSLKDAARFLDCPIFSYKHRNAGHAARAIARCGPHAKVILLTDGVFAQEGTLAPLPELLKALPRDGTLLLDDAHGAGVLGENGRGTVEHFGIRDKRIVQAITLSKAFGTYGGAVLGDRKLCQTIIERSDLFAGATPPPLPLATAAIAALATVAADSALRARLRRNLKLIAKDVPILSVVPRSAAETARLKKRLLANKIFPSFIRYPGGPSQGYFRFAISSEHTPAQIKRLLEAIRHSQ